MKVLIDTNVIIDFYCQRPEFYDNAASVFDMAVKQEIELLISPISFVNFFYITRKDFTVAERYEILRGLMEVCTIPNTNEEVLQKASATDIPDFEDMVQMQSAILAEADCIITRNKKDFISATIPVHTPYEFLNR